MVADKGTVLAENYERDDVEADGLAGISAGAQPVDGDPFETLALRLGFGLSWKSLRRVLAGVHFHEDHGALVFCHEVDGSSFAAVGLVEDVVSTGGEEMLAGLVGAIDELHFDLLEFAANPFGLPDGAHKPGCRCTMPRGQSERRNRKTVYS